VLKVLPVEEDEPVRRLVSEARVSVARMLLRRAIREASTNCEAVFTGSMIKVLNV